MSDTRTVTPSKAKRALRHAMKLKRPVFLWGAMGIGKSDIVKQLADEFDAPMIDVRLSLWEPTDIKGIPYLNTTVVEKNGDKMEKNDMDWAKPIELPDADFAAQHKNIVLFLDEMNSAAPTVQAAAYQLILNRRVGKYHLPDNVMIVAAGNRDADKGVTYRMPAPLANRFVHLEMTHSFDDWFEWAVNNGVHKDVVGFLQFSKGDLFGFDSKSASRAFATPRSWSFVSELLDEGVDESILTDLVSGTIGEGLAIKFMAHRRVASNMPKPSDILDGKVKELKTKEVSAMYSLTVALCYELKESDDNGDKLFNKKVDNFLRFCMDNFETEMVVMGLQLALRQYALPIDVDELQHFDEFDARYGKYITAAHGV